MDTHASLRCKSEDATAFSASMVTMLLSPQYGYTLSHPEILQCESSLIQTNHACTGLDFTPPDTNINGKNAHATRVYLTRQAVTKGLITFMPFHVPCHMTLGPGSLAG